MCPFCSEVLLYHVIARLTQYRVGIWVAIRMQCVARAQRTRARRGFLDNPCRLTPPFCDLWWTATADVGLHEVFFSAQRYHSWLSPPGCSPYEYYMTVVCRTQFVCMCVCVFSLLAVWCTTVPYTCINNNVALLWMCGWISLESGQATWDSDGKFIEHTLFTQVITCCNTYKAASRAISYKLLCIAISPTANNGGEL